MTNPNPAAPLTEAGVDELRRMRREGTTWGPAYSGDLIDSLLATLDAARATSTSAGLREALVRRLIAEYDEDNRRSPSFVTIGLLREAVGED
jgi:hypothetical protein